MNTQPNLSAFRKAQESNLFTKFGVRVPEAIQHQFKKGNEEFMLQVEQAAKEQDAERLLRMLDNTLALDFVEQNRKWLQEIDQYEMALLQAYTGTRANWSNWPKDFVFTLFDAANRADLLSTGDTLPGPGPFTLFRGVAGHGPKRRIRGISWTDDFEKAQWFAKWNSLPKPAVFKAVIPASRVYAFCNGREEREFLCDVRSGVTLKNVWSE